MDHSVATRVLRERRPPPRRFPITSKFSGLSLNFFQRCEPNCEKFPILQRWRIL